MPDNGTLRPTFTSPGACARATPDRPIAAAPESIVRRVIEPFDVSFFIVVLPKIFPEFLLHSKIGAPDAVVRAQRLLVAFERDAAGFQHITMVGGFKRLGDALLDQQDGQFRLPADFD